jgi:coenzyme F420-0:L-glutamate ligase/coenzyme F420-1:gamma-L-glutamate ligase
MEIEIIPVVGLPMIEPGDDLAKLIFDETKNSEKPLHDGDILVITHKVVSKAEGRLVNLASIDPSKPALNFAVETGKDPRFVEVVLRESRAVRRIAPGVLITETRQGFVCANSGVDKSNVAGAENLALLPEDPDRSADRIRNRLKEIGGVDVTVIISDTHGRAHRVGEVNVSVGSSGICVMCDRRGEKDLFEYELRVKSIAVADELAAAAELVIGQADEGIPVAIIRGYAYRKDDHSKSIDLVWSRDKDLFP